MGILCLKKLVTGLGLKGSYALLSNLVSRQMYIKIQVLTLYHLKIVSYTRIKKTFISGMLKWAHHLVSQILKLGTPPDIKIYNYST